VPEPERGEERSSGAPAAQPHTRPGAEQNRQRVGTGSRPRR
jgi:hypothetical protein